MKELEDIDHLFKSEFDDFAVVPPASVKEAIDKNIAAIRRKKLLIRFFSVLSVLLLIAVATFFLLRDPGTENTTAQASAVQSPGGKANDPIPNASPQHQDRSGVSSPLSSKPGTPETSGALPTGTPGKKAASPSSSFSPPAGNGKKTSSDNRTAPAKSKRPVYINADTKQKRATRSGETARSSSQVSGGLSTIAGNDDTGPQAATGQPVAENPAESRSGQQSGAATAKAEEKKPAAGDTLTPYAKEDSIYTPEPFKNAPARNTSWLFSLKPGIGFGFSQRKDTSSMKIEEKNTFFVQAEASYFFTERFALTSGLSYHTRTENYFKELPTTQSVIVDYQVQYVYDSSMAVIDSIFVPVYNVDTVAAQLRSSYRLYSIGIPVFFTWSQPLSAKLCLDLSAGAVFSIQGYRAISNDLLLSPTVNKPGVKACLRAQLRYQFSRWGVSLNSNFGYDLTPGIQLPEIQRKRSFLEVGAGIHYLLGK